MKQTVRDFNRFEQKYVVSLDEAWAFRDRLEGYVERDDHAGPRGTYGISSLYFDSPQLHAFWEKVEGVKFRRKVRVRRYDAEERDRWFIEIKQRIDKTVQKRRTTANLETVKKLMQTGEWDEAVLGRNVVAGEVGYLLDAFGLEPTVIISYEREPFVGIYDPSLRVTFDTHLRARKATLEHWGDPRDGRLVLPLDRAVVEVKFDNFVPLWLCHLLHELEYVSERMSKYCNGINAFWYPQGLPVTRPPELAAQGIY